MQVVSRTLESSTVSVPPFPIVALPMAPKAAPGRDAVIEIPMASPWSVSSSKRLLDFSVAFLVLAVFFLPLLVVALCVRLGSDGPSPVCAKARWPGWETL